MKMTPACLRFARTRQQTPHSPLSFPAIPDVAVCRTAGFRARTFWLAVYIGAAMALLAGRAVHAEPASTSGAQVAPDPVAATFAEAAQRFRHVGVVDTRRYASGERWRCAGGVVQGCDGSDANHA